VWTVHIGGSFSDVASSYSLYRQVETLLHSGVTQGCTTSTYCPGNGVTRAQMAVFIARALAGSEALVPKAGSVEGRGDYQCVPAGTSLFADIDPTVSYCAHVHAMAAVGVTLGCGDGSSYCPASIVSRGAMAMFVARSVAGSDTAVPLSYTDAGTGRSYSCDSGGTPVTYFSDVPATAQYCRHAHYLWLAAWSTGVRPLRPGSARHPASPAARWRSPGQRVRVVGSDQSRRSSRGPTISVPPNATKATNSDAAPPWGRSSSSILTPVRAMIG